MLRWWGSLAIGIAFILAGYAFREWGYEPYRVATQQMSPTYLPGDWIWIEKWPFRIGNASQVDLHYGDIVVVRVENGVSVGRVVGLGGDQVMLRSGRVFLNGESVSSKAFLPNQGSECATEASKKSGVTWQACYVRPFIETSVPVVLESDEAYIVGDFRRQLFPFRTYGRFKKADILGRVIRGWKLGKRNPGSPPF